MSRLVIQWLLVGGRLTDIQPNLVHPAFIFSPDGTQFRFKPKFLQRLLQALKASITHQMALWWLLSKMHDGRLSNDIKLSILQPIVADKVQGLDTTTQEHLIAINHGRPLTAMSLFASPPCRQKKEMVQPAQTLYNRDINSMTF